MVGAAAESLILDLAGIVISVSTGAGRRVPKELQDWRIKRVLDSLQSFFATNKQAMDADVRDELEAYWPAFTQQIRAVRNEAGHPSSVAVINQEVVHAALLVFPELAKLHKKLKAWVQQQWIGLGAPAAS